MGVAAQNDPQYLTLAQTAKLSGFSLHTLYEWVETHRLGRAEGVFKVSRHYRVAWETFRARVIESGDF